MGTRACKIHVCEGCMETRACKYHICMGDVHGIGNLVVPHMYVWLAWKLELVIFTYVWVGSMETEPCEIHVCLCGVHVNRSL